jgi:hypothetical protein
MATITCADGQKLSIQVATAPPLQYDLYSLGMAPGMNMTFGVGYFFYSTSKVDISSGLELSALRTSGYFPSCGNLTMIVPLSERYYLLEVPLNVSIDLIARQALTNPKALSFGVSIGKMLNNNENVAISNFLGAQLGYAIWNIQTKHLHFRLATGIKATRITQECSPGLAISPGLQLMAFWR